MMCKLVNQQSAPEIDIDVFGGNPLELEFHYFMAVCDNAVCFFFLSGFSFTNIHDSWDSRGKGRVSI